MGDFLRSGIFLACQLLLLVFVLSPFLFAGRAGARRIARRAVLPAAAAILFATAAVDIVIGARAFRAGAGHGLVSEAFAGKPIVLRFYPETCLLMNLGTIACDTDYHARYERRENRWTVTGYNRADMKIITAAAANADPFPGHLSLWGSLARLDESGALIIADQQVGTVRPMTERDQPLAPNPSQPPASSPADRSPPVAQAALEGGSPKPRGLLGAVFEGKPVVIRFAARTCEEFNLGTIACEEDYRGSYDRSANRWTVTGYHKGDRKVVTFDAVNAEPGPGSISVWGMLSRFDEAGTMTYLGRPVGKLRLASEPSGQE